MAASPPIFTQIAAQYHRYAPECALYFTVTYRTLRYLAFLMPRREAVPLFKTRHAAFVKAAKHHPDIHKKVIGLLGINTGPRPDTLCHTHSSWFSYEDGELYYEIPARALCRKYGDTEPCGDCNTSNHSRFQPKTGAGEGRRVLITNKWTNPVTGDREYHGLRDTIESYFALKGPEAPEELQHGQRMVGRDGISKDTLSNWVRDIAARSSIRPDRRRQQLLQEIDYQDPEENNDRKIDQIREFGTDDDGNGIPDLFAHDLRACFCTQLMRNDVPPIKAINKTGHADSDSMLPYIRFAKGEITSDEERTWI